MRLIVDACNFMFRHKRLSRMLGRRPFEEVRAAICAVFESYRREGKGSGVETVLVFDGSDVAASAPRFCSSPGVRVVFSDEGQTADRRILEELDGCPRPAECTVVTSDRALGRAARERGAKVVGVEEFIAAMEKRAKAYQARNRQPGSGEKPEGKLDAGEVEDWMRRFGIDE
ncbi:MAG: NYN domain-containing protein [Planctomycetota bacterium]|nr:NYN domain-containing protein [Planctomycetota bacterium]